MRKEQLSSKVALVFDDDRIKVSSPYDKAFISGVKSIGGKWDSSSKTWCVPADIEQRLRELLQECYGTPLDPAGEKTLKISFDPLYFMVDDDIRVGGKRVCWRRSRDSAVSYAADSYLSGGEIDSRGGSAKYPAVFDQAPKKGEISMVTIIAESVYERLTDEQKAATTILQVAEGASELDQLKAKRAKLQEELQALEAKIKSLEA